MPVLDHLIIQLPDRPIDMQLFRNFKSVAKLLEE